MTKISNDILKINWERFLTHNDMGIRTIQKLIEPFSTDKILSYKFLSNGCANFNYKVNFQDRDPVALRIFARDKCALGREFFIHKLVEQHIPVPKIQYSDNGCQLISYPYAVTEYIDGPLMRSVLLDGDFESTLPAIEEAGAIISKLSSIKFDKGGFFQENGDIIPFEKQEEYIPFAMMRLNEEIIIDSIGNTLKNKTISLIHEYESCIPPVNEANLTHADFDPANLLIRLSNDTSKIASVLDWEFAFSGTYYMDIGTMIRYSHKLPSEYERAFINGFESNNIHLPTDWKKKAKLMDLICLLNLLYYNPKNERPIMNYDVSSLITYTIDNFEKF